MNIGLSGNIETGYACGGYIEPLASRFNYL